MGNIKMRQDLADAGHRVEAYDNKVGLRRVAWLDAKALLGAVELPIRVGREAHIYHLTRVQLADGRVVLVTGADLDFE